VTYKFVDTIEACVSSKSTNTRQILTHTVTTKDTVTTSNKGVICNLGGLIPDFTQETHTVKIYLWVVSSAATSLLVKGCPTNGSAVANYCTTLTDYTQSVSGGLTYTANQLQKEVISITYPGTAADCLSVSLNGGTVNIFL
jgi:hypothetical protein